jgi:hypothetical protein
MISDRRTAPPSGDIFDRIRVEVVFNCSGSQSGPARSIPLARPRNAFEDTRQVQRPMGTTIGAGGGLIPALASSGPLFTPPSCLSGAMSSLSRNGRRLLKAYKRGNKTLVNPNSIDEMNEAWPPYRCGNRTARLPHVDGMNDGTDRQTAARLFALSLKHCPAGFAEVGLLPSPAGGDCSDVGNLARSEATSDVRPRFCSGVASSACARPVANNSDNKPSANTR